MGELLDKINGPSDLKQLSIDELKQLADEVRELILGSVSRTGGHLASNLGVVELTLAMHYVFDFTKDKLLWDVGHQCYAHKLITGRKDGFSKLRKVEGLSGFPNPEESDCDQFMVGHAGTAIATAIGMALGQKQTGGDANVVALVGDASVVNGVSFEALNNLSLVKRQMLVVLNDNSMAIDQTEGAVAKYFSKVRLSHTYEDFRRTTNSILDHMPLIGKPMEEALERLKKTIRMVFPASQMFEGMKIPYFGPVDGHDVAALVQIFEGMKELDRPVILHVYTKKGKGYSPAEENGAKFHSTGPFAINGDAVESGSPVKGRSFTKVFGEHLVELAEKDNRIVAITAAMCDGTGLGEFRDRFADRFYDVGIAESAAVDIAAGLAKSGLKPVVCVYSSFMQRAFDQVFEEAALQGLGVVFCVDRAGLVGPDGPTHHGLMDIGFMRMIPGVVVMGPANEAEVKGALDFAVNSDKPCVIRYPKDVVPQDDYDRRGCEAAFELGKSVVVREGENSKVAIVAYGSVLTQALEAAEKLSGDGIEADVVNARFASPIDEDMVRLAASKGIVTVEDHHVAGGFGGAFLETAARVMPGEVLKPVSVIGVGAEYLRHDSRGSQLELCGINADKIAEAVRKMRPQL